MRVIKLLIFLCAAYGGYQYWQQHQTAKQLQAMTNGNGFVEIPTPDGQDENVVYVVAAENCPHEEAQRADRLAEALSRANISVRRTHHVGFSSLKDQGGADRINVVMNGELPIVFLHGRAKANPSLDEVMSELRERAHSR